MYKPRYGIWIPVYGNCGATNHPNEPRNASYERAKYLIELAEEYGFTTSLIAEHIINPRNQELDQLETWSTAAPVFKSNKLNRNYRRSKTFAISSSSLSKNGIKY